MYGVSMSKRWTYLSNSSITWSKPKLLIHSSEGGGVPGSAPIGQASKWVLPIEAVV